MSRLVPCPGCSRHVRDIDVECPFCACTLEFTVSPELPLPRLRLGRSAAFAVGASLLSAFNAEACKEAPVPPAVVVNETAAPIYGAPPMPLDAAVAPSPEPDAGTHAPRGDAGTVLGIASPAASGGTAVRQQTLSHRHSPPYPSGKPPSGPAARMLLDP